MQIHPDRIVPLGDLQQSRSSASGGWRRWLLSRIDLSGRRVQLHEDDFSLNDDDDMDEESDDTSTTVQVNTSELLFDLIFVALSIELSHLFQENVSVDYAFQVFVLFACSWLTWTHTTILLNRFKLNAPWSWLLGMVFVGTFGFAGRLPAGVAPSALNSQPYGFA